LQYLHDGGEEAAQRDSVEVGDLGAFDGDDVSLVVQIGVEVDGVTVPQRQADLRLAQVDQSQDPFLQLLLHLLQQTEQVLTLRQLGSWWRSR